MYHYIANIVSHSEIISNRDPGFFEAGYNRIMFIADAIDEEIQIVSMGAGTKKGFFKKQLEQHSKKVKIIYLPQLHITLFKKKLRHFFYSFFLLIYLIKNVKRNDKLIVYNTSKSFFMIMPILIFGFFKKIIYILEIEELYSYKRSKNKLNFSESISIKYASGYIIVNKNIQKFINNKKPILLNAGYYSDASNLKSNNGLYNNLQIVYSGRLDDVGGINVFLESLQFINSKCEVVITGRGEKELHVKNFKNKNPLVNLRFLGILEKSEYDQLLNNSHIAINPISEKDDFSDVSFPSKILQYLSFGLIVVSSNIEALNVLDQLNKYIYTFNDDSSKELAQQINILLKAKSFQSELIRGETKKYFGISTKKINLFVKMI